MDLATDEFETNITNLIEKRSALETYYESNNIGTVNFKTVARSPHIISITLNNHEAEEYLILKSKEFLASTGSACNAELLEHSHVLIELKMNNVIRLSI